MSETSRPLEAAGRRFPIRVHSSWALLTVLLSGLFAVIHFRSDPGVSAAVAVGLGVVTSALLFGSVLLRELAHAFMARRAGLRVRRITLKLFGGHTDLADDPPDPGSELRIALAGPLATLALLAGFALLSGAGSGLPPPVRTVATNLALINLLLLAFNLIPAVPLDGGRILRAVLWSLWGRPAAATRAVTAATRSFGLLLVGFGILALFGGGAAGGTPQLVFGAWFILVGFQLRGAAGEVTRRLWIADTLEGVTAEALLDYRILPAERGASGDELAAMGASHEEIPVVEDTRLVGAVRVADLHGHPRETWADLTAGSLMRTDIVRRTVGPDASAAALLPLFRDGRRSVAVLDGPELVGFVTLDTLRKRLSLHSGG